MSAQSTTNRHKSPQHHTYDNGISDKVPLFDSLSDNDLRNIIEKNKKNINGLRSDVERYGLIYQILENGLYPNSILNKLINLNRSSKVEDVHKKHTYSVSNEIELFNVLSDDVLRDIVENNKKKFPELQVNVPRSILIQQILQYGLYPDFIRDELIRLNKINSPFRKHRIRSLASSPRRSTLKITQLPSTKSNEKASKVTAEKTPKATIGKTSKTTTEKVPKATIEKTSKTTIRKTSKTTTEKIPKATTGKTSKATTEKVPKATTKKEPKVASKMSKTKPPASPQTTQSPKTSKATSSKIPKAKTSKTTVAGASQDDSYLSPTIETLSNMTINDLKKIIKREKSKNPELRIALPKNELVDQILRYQLPIYAMAPSPKDPLSPPSFSPRKPTDVACEGIIPYEKVSSSNKWHGRDLWLIKFRFVQDHMGDINNFTYNEDGNMRYIDDDYNICWESNIYHDLDSNSSMVPTKEFYNYINTKYKDINAEVYVPRIKEKIIRTKMSSKNKYVLHPEALRDDGRPVGVVICRGRIHDEPELDDVIADTENVRWIFVNDNIESDPDIYIDVQSLAFAPIDQGTVDYIISYNCINNLTKKRSTSFDSIFWTAKEAGILLKPGGKLYWNGAFKSAIKWAKKNNLPDDVDGLRNILNEVLKKYGYRATYNVRNGWHILEKL